MKFNLENFPQCKDKDSIASLVIWLTETQEWKERFEAQLRNEQVPKINRKLAPIMYNYYKGRKDLAKEILGE